MQFDFKRAIADNWPVKATALALAGLLWAAVRAGEPTTLLIPVQIEVEVPDGLVISQPLPPVQALFSGSTRELFKFYATPPRIEKAIPEGFEGTSYHVELSREDLNLSDAVAAVTDLQPRAIDVAVDSLERRWVMVEVRGVSVRPEAGFELGTLTVTPESVEVVGAASLVRGIDVLYTVATDLGEKSEEFSQTVPLDTTSFRNVEVLPARVNVTAPVRRVSDSTRTLSRRPAVSRNGAPATGLRRAGPRTKRLLPTPNPRDREPAGLARARASRARLAALGR